MVSLILSRYYGGEGGQHTANRRLLVLLEIVVDEAKDERGLGKQWLALCPGGSCTCRRRHPYLSHGSFAEQDQLDAAAGLGGVGRISHGVRARRGLCSMSFRSRVGRQDGQSIKVRRWLGSLDNGLIRDRLCIEQTGGCDDEDGSNRQAACTYPRLPSLPAPDRHQPPEPLRVRSTYLEALCVAQYATSAGHFGGDAVQAASRRRPGA